MSDTDEMYSVKELEDILFHERAPAKVTKAFKWFKSQLSLDFALRQSPKYFFEAGCLAALETLEEKLKELK